MSYSNYLSGIAGPRTICVDLYEPLMSAYARLAMMRDYHINFEELFEELVAFATEDHIAEAGADYYISYLQETMEQLDTCNGDHDMSIYLPVVEYLARVIRNTFRNNGMYIDGVANYRLAKWVTPTTIVFEKYLTFDMTPTHPPGTGLLVRVESFNSATNGTYAAVIDANLRNQIKR